MSTVDFASFAINWSEEPDDDYERRIRQLVIRRVTDVSTTASWELECLADDRDLIANDLKSAIENARAAEREEYDRRRRGRNAELVRLAIADAAAKEVALGEALQSLETAFIATLSRQPL